MSEFLTKQQIVNNIIATMEDESRIALQNMAIGDLYQFHHSTGRHIRNHYLLWDPQNPLTMLDYVPELREDVDYNPKHPDAVSMDIMKEVWRTFNT